jgi:DNA polymerase III delta prime subunit
MNNADTLTELLRPQQLSELTLPDRDIQRLQKMADTGRIANMIFYGPPGLGKTSAARILQKASEDDYHWKVINGSLHNGIENIRRDLEGYATSTSVFGKGKICLIDEADFLSQNAQASMRGLIEKSIRNCRFVLTVNDITKIMPALISRTIAIPFAISVVDRPTIIRRLQDRLSVRLTEIGVSFTRERLDQIVSIYFPDLRAVVNHLDYEFV